MGHRRDTALVTTQAVLYLVCIAVAVATSTQEQWARPEIFGALLFFAIASDMLVLDVRNLRLSGAFAGIVLAMALLGPAPAMVIALVTIAIDALRIRSNPAKIVANFFTYAAFSLTGGIALQAALPLAGSNLGAGGIVLAGFLVASVLNFCLIFAPWTVTEDLRWRDGFRDMFLPVMPAQLGIGLLTAGVFMAEIALGSAALLVMAPVIVTFQWVLRTAIIAMERGEQVEERNRQLSALQFGLISTTLKTLALRDHMTARHSAAVARYAREVAVELGLPEREQELIHTAALFHDIGKFIFPDSILLADTRLTDEQYEIVKQHPAVGAELIGEIEGYGPVAEIVRHHHERIDGRGYPDGLTDQEIPLGSKIIAAADVYDVLTARDTYRKPVSTADAFAELRRSAGTQLDADIVETFINVIESRGVAFRHSTEADFEAELALERRVSDYAAPKERVRAA